VLWIHHKTETRDSGWIGATLDRGIMNSEVLQTIQMLHNKLDLLFAEVAIPGSSYLPTVSSSKANGAFLRRGGPASAACRGLPAYPWPLPGSG